MLKIYCFLIGEDYNRVRLYQQDSKRKIALLSSLMMIPVILWFWNTYMMVTYVMKSSAFNGILAGIIASSIIFIIERAVILSKGGFKIATLRIFLGFLIAVLGSISLDEVIFTDDIDHQVYQLKQDRLNDVQTSVESRYANEIAQLQNDVKESHEIWTESLLNAQKESDGSGGTKYQGVGQVAKFKKSIADQQELVYMNNLTRLESSHKILSLEKEKRLNDVESSFNSNGLLIRIKAMFQLISSDSFMLMVYILFTLLLLLIESMVVLIKCFSEKSTDEILEEKRNEIQKLRALRVLDSHQKHFNGNNELPELSRAKHLINKPYKSILNQAS